MRVKRARSPRRLLLSMMMASGVTEVVRDNVAGAGGVGDASLSSSDMVEARDSAIDMVSSLPLLASASFDLSAGAIDKSKSSEVWPAFDEDTGDETSRSFILEGEGGSRFLVAS